MKNFLKVIIVFLPWKLKRAALEGLLGYTIHPTARIGLSWVYPRNLVMASGATIGHFNMGVHLDLIRMGEKSSIARKNWITGFTTGSDSRHFAHQKKRQSELLLGDHSAITKNHHIDCTSSVTIGRFVTIGGYYSQILTHAVDLIESRQDSSPIVIGDYSFVGTNVVILGGARLPARSMLGAKSLLNKPYEDEWMVYAGVPARPLKELPKDAAYFSRSEGFIY